MGCDVGVTRWSCGISDSTSILDGPGVESRRGKGVGGSGKGGAGRRTRFDCLQYWKQKYLFSKWLLFIYSYHLAYKPLALGRNNARRYCPGRINCAGGLCVAGWW